jgi:hypothetical protein
MAVGDASDSSRMSSNRKLCLGMAALGMVLVGAPAASRQLGRCLVLSRVMLIGSVAADA